MAELALTQPKESSRSKEAFALYWALGPKRSLAKLADFYVEQGFGSNRSSLLRQFQRWSTDGRWQDKIRGIAAEQIEQANELKTTTYINILGEYHRRISDEPRRQIMELHSLHGIYDRVKPTEQTQSTEPPGTLVVRLEIVPPRQQD